MKKKVDSERLKYLLKWYDRNCMGKGALVFYVLIIFLYWFRYEFGIWWLILLILYIIESLLAGRERVKIRKRIEEELRI